MLEIAGKLLDVAKALLGLYDRFSKAAFEERLRASVLLKEISICLSEVSGLIRADKVPHGKCGELEAYAKNLPDALERPLGSTTATEIGNLLFSAHRVEGLAIEMADITDKEMYLRDIDEASGKLMALSNMLKSQ